MSQETGVWRQASVTSGRVEKADMPVVFTGEEEEGGVKGCEDEVLVDGEAEEEGVGDLAIAVEAGREGFGQGVPVGDDGLEAIAGLPFEFVEGGAGLGDGQNACRRVGKDANDTGFCKGAERPMEARRLEPA